MYLASTSLYLKSSKNGLLKIGGCLSYEIKKIKINFAVIGSGPAGQTAALQVAKLGKSVVIIEKEIVPGGHCLNSATIPSKSLREAIIDLTNYHERSFYGSSCLREVTILDLNYRLNTVLEGERAVLLHNFKKNKISFIQGRAQFQNPNQLAILNDKGECFCEISADKILIATGSEPRNPMDIPFDSNVILDSTRLLTIENIPDTMIVLGGGVVGTEYASFFALLGTKVIVLDKQDRFLDFLDEEIGAHLQYSLKEFGLVFVPHKRPKIVERMKNCGRVICEDDSIYEGEVILYALGREANIKDLNIHLSGVQVNERGFIPTNQYFQTSIPHIYAAGDVIGFPALASTSMEQGRLAGRHAYSAETPLFPKLFPLGIYTIPEISSCGYTEEELQKKNISYGIGRAYYYEIARSHITGSGHIGLFKILFNRNNLDILGTHIIGRNATELIHIGQVAMSFGAKLDYFVNQVFNYPTFAEGYRIAALNGLNKIRS
ncbi:MAG: Si-specific NAD(P)(+) transhydrogenase [Chlamydiales bacterium]